MSSIKSILAGTLLAGSALGFNSCESGSNMVANSRKEVIKEFMADRPAKEYNKAVGSWREGILAPADAQSTLDSVAFRQVFDGTILSTDSESVKQFNSIAGKMRVGNHTDYNSAFEDLDNKMLDQNIKVKEIPANAKEYGAYETRTLGLFGTNTYKNEHRVMAARQFKADSLAYTNFFKERGRLTPGIEKSIKEISKQIKLKP